MNKGYDEFKIFVRHFLKKYVEITSEYEHARSGEYYYFFSLNEKNYALEISDGFCLYVAERIDLAILKDLPNWRILWAPLENDFEGLKNLITNLSI